MVKWLRRGYMGAFAASRVWTICVLGAVGIAQACWAQTGSDGAIGGRVLSAAGSPVAGAQVVVREIETGLELRAVSVKR